MKEGAAGSQVAQIGTLVVAQLRDLDETPLRAVELRMIGLAEIGDADQLAVGAVAPAVIGAGENRGVAFVVAAHLHAAVAARIQEDVDLAGPVAAQDHQFLAHARDEEIAGVRDLAFVTDEQPGAGEQPLLLLAVDLLVDKDLAADLPCCPDRRDPCDTLTRWPSPWPLLGLGLLSSPAPGQPHARPVVLMQ